ncbi:MAG: nucleotide exchange factor GrpE [Firmicutes bacterium]|nr:nucleotide exchange factor GrpE [Bacillota bacterium]
MSKKKPEEAVPENTETPVGRDAPGAPETTAPEAVAEIVDLTPELDAERDKYLRLLAEYDNFRKRSAREREAIFADVRADTVTKFLPVYDNLARALAQQCADEAYYKGIELIMAQLTETLTKLGVTEIPALGEKFDPELHNAVVHTEDENKSEGIIVEEFQKGFKLGDKVIRHSMVKVVN